MADILIANNDQDYTISGVPALTPVLWNDTLNGSGPVTLADLQDPPVVTSAPTHGVTTVLPSTGEISYQPNPGHAGIDTYAYEITLSGDTPPDPNRMEVFLIPGKLLAPAGTILEVGGTTITMTASPTDVPGGQAFLTFPASMGWPPGFIGAYEVHGSALQKVISWGPQPNPAVTHICLGPYEFLTAYNENLIEVPTQIPLWFTSLSAMFAFASSFDFDISNWNTSNIQRMDAMFFKAENFNQDISGWDTGRVISMSSMFAYTEAFNQDIGGWNVENVFFMYAMFENAEAFNQDLSGWCVPSVPTAPSNFDNGAISWVLPRPDWGTCAGVTPLPPIGS